MLMRLAAWLTLYALLCFAWVVLIEHGPEDFWAGARLEWQNAQGWLAARSQPSVP